MGDFYKEMYNFDKVKEYVDSEISDVEEEISNVELEIPPILFVSITNNGETITSNKTYTEIKTALLAGKLIVTNYKDTVDNYTYTLTQSSQEGTGNTEIHLSGTNYADSNGCSIIELVVKSDNSIVFHQYVSE